MNEQDRAVKFNDRDVDAIVRWLRMRQQEAEQHHATRIAIAEQYGEVPKILKDRPDAISVMWREYADNPFID